MHSEQTHEDEYNTNIRILSTSIIRATIKQTAEIN